MKKKTKLKLLSKILVFVFLISNLYFPLEALGASAETDFPAYSDAIDYGRGVFSAAVTGGAICYDEDGNPLMCFSTQGGKFFICDLLTGKIIDEKAITGKFVMSHLVKTASDGKVYNHHNEGNTFDVYDPLTGEYQEVYPGVNIHSQDGGNVTDDGKILLGSYNTEGACVYEYDIETNTTRTFGPLDVNTFYVKGVDADENYIYAGTGSGDKTKVYRIDRSTGEFEVIYDIGSSILYNVKVNSDYIVAQTGTGCYIIDKNNYSNVKLVAGNDPSDPSPYDENLFYNIQYSKYIHRIDVKNKTTKHVATISGLDSYEEPQFTQWATLPTGEKVLGFRTNMMNKIGYFNPQTNETVVHQLDRIADAGPKIQSLEISSDDIIYMGGYQSSMAAYDIKKEEFLYKLQYWKQNEGVGFMNGKTYFGIYTGAELWRYDPEKEWNYTLYKTHDGNAQGADANPRMVYDIKDSQDRPFVIEEYNNKLYIGTIPTYENFGGSLTIYSEDETGEPTVEFSCRNIIENQSITGIAVKDNLVYLSSSITGGLGNDPIETQAKIAVFDTSTNTLVTEPFTPDLPIIGTNSKAIGELSFGPDGLLWGASSNQGLIFALDPETFEVKKYVSVANSDQGAFMRPVYLKWGYDGLLYTTAGAHLAVINPETMTYKRLTRNVAIMSLDSKGDIWYAKQGNFYKMEVNQFARLQAILDSIDFNDYESSTALGELKLLCDSAKLLTEDSERKDIIDAIKNINAKKKELNNTSKYVSDFSAELNYTTQTVTISGTLKTGEEVSVRILAPDGTVVLLDQVSKDVKGFTKTYRISPLIKGEYKIYLDAKSYLKPVMRAVNSNPPEDRVVIQSNSEKDNSGTVTTRLSNYYNNTVTLNVFVAEYYKQSQILKQSKFETYKVDPGNFAIFESQFGSTSDTEFKLFIWDENMAPVTAPFEN